MKALNTLFEGSPYSIDSLPTYPGVINGGLEFQEVTHPIMKGLGPDRRPFIAMRLKCTFTQDNIDFHKNKGDQCYAKPGSKHNKVLTLYQYNEKLLYSWCQPPKAVAQPYFFKNYIFDSNPQNKEIVMPQEQKGFNLLHELLVNGKGKDLNGVEWEIVK